MNYMNKSIDQGWPGADNVDNQEKVLHSDIMKNEHNCLDKYLLNSHEKSDRNDLYISVNVTGVYVIQSCWKWNS